MSKSQKELAFLRNLYVEPDYTQRFTDFFDENFKFTNERKILYINAGTGNHALALRGKLKDKSELSATSENADSVAIAKAKADAVKATVNFTNDVPNEKFDAVLADASFVRPSALENFLSEIIELSDDKVIFFLPTASSFGDIFSFLWETLLNADLLDKGAEVERLISEIPTVSKVEELAGKLGLENIQTEIKPEFFDFETGEEFINFPLVADFLLPDWLDFLDAAEIKRVKRQMVKIIDAERGATSFRFTVKMSLFSGQKRK